jgi:aerobic carbon-monoxide dehydrogenase medium subunit
MPFELVEPEMLNEALALLDPEDPSVRAIAGGTGLMLMIKSGFFQPKRLVSLRRVGGSLTAIRSTAEGEWRIGAMVRLTDLERGVELCRSVPVIAATLSTHSNVRVRNVATIGGNLAHADPHMDLAPVLVALGAAVEAVSLARQRTIPVENLSSGYYETTLANDELITELVIPPQRRRRSAYVKCTTRSADDWPALGVAVSLDAAAGVIHEPRIVISAATEKPTRLARAEALLHGIAIGDAILHEAGRVAAAEAVVIADDRGSASYKKQLVKVHVERALRTALELPQ